MVKALTSCGNIQQNACPHDGVSPLLPWRFDGPETRHSYGGCSSEGTELILFNAGFQVIHITVPAILCQFGHKTPSDKSRMVWVIACVMLWLKVIR